MTAKAVEMLPGVVRETLAHTDRLMVIRVTFKAGSAVPPHSHPHDQSSYIERGLMRYTVGSITHELGPGNAIVIPGGVEHRAEALEDTIDINSFSPARQDYLDG